MATNQALIPRPTTQRQIADLGCQVWFVTTEPALGDLVTPTLGIRRLTTDIQVCRITGRGEGLYVMWILPDDPDRLWSTLLDNQSLRYYHNHKATLVPHAVFAEYLNGLPLHQYLALIGNRAGRAAGLFAQAYGHRNINPCNCCETRYLQYYRPSDPTDRHSNPIHLLWPFFECISLPGFQEGACGNCLYLLQRGKCVYAAQPRDPHVRPMRASRSTSIGLPDRRLSLESCPIDYEFDGLEMAKKYYRDQRFHLGLPDGPDLDVETWED